MKIMGHTLGPEDKRYIMGLTLMGVGYVVIPMITMLIIMWM